MSGTDLASRERPRPEVVVRCDGSEHLGLGHVSRTLALARELERQGAKVCFLMPASSAFARDRVAAHEFAVSAVELEEVHVDGAAVVVDSPVVSDGTLETVRRAGGLVCLIDDLGDRSLRPVHVLVNQNPGEPRYRDTGQATCLCGPLFALLAPEFLALRGRSRSRGLRLLIAFGASDPLDATARILEMAVGLREWDEIVALLGPGFCGGEALRQRWQPETRVRFVHDPADMVSLLAGVDAAVTAAGSMCYELAVVGVPFVTVVVAADHRAIAGPLEKLGLAPCAGELDRITPSGLRRALHPLLDPEERARRAQGMDTLVDGRGAERVAAQLLARLDGGLATTPLDAAAPGRMQQLLALDGDAVAKLGPAYSNIAWDREAFERALPGKAALSCCALYGDGVAAFWVASASVPGSCHTHRVAVAASCRGRGVAGRMFEAVRRRAGQLGLERMTLEVGWDNESATRFYRRLGFRDLDRSGIEAYLAARHRAADVFSDHLRESDGSRFRVLARPV